MEENPRSPLDIVADVAEFANAVASLVVGHRKILVEGQFDVNLADQMASALHASLLGLVHEWPPEEEILIFVEEEEGDFE